MALVPSTHVAIRISATAAQANRTFDQVRSRLTRLDGPVRNLNLSFRRLDRIWTLLAVGSGAALIKTFVDMASQMQRTQVQLATFSKDFQTASRELDKMLDLSTKVPFGFNEITKSAVRLKAAGLDPMDGSLKSILDALASFGGGNDELRRLTIGMQQIAGKGVVSMEELRQQIGEAVPLAMRVMAKQAEISVSELISQVTAGTLEAKKGLDLLTEGFARFFGGASERILNTFSGQMSQVVNSFNLLSKAIFIDSGLIHKMTAALKLFNSTVQDFARRLGDSPEVVDAFWNSLKNLALFAAEAAEPLRSLWNIIKIFVSAVSDLTSAMPAEIVGGGVIGFILFGGLGGAVVGSIFGAYHKTITGVFGLVAESIKVVMRAIDESGLGEATIGGLIGWFLFGKEGALVGFLAGTHCRRSAAGL